ncbi:ABC transporter permease [Bifidobacterium sp. DSM 109958]|uniref:ABC transporter permease n=1 Tax=Bifidobacterium moraviense TaxID=2675323 RepID=A0A7Y0F1F5_9BIFI|nr:sugar ABC transporter permease [Bifidobacterium sp. DSM 109958]NMN00260.1 ABC transporter permease [Bifidobacterium sp. DSM 109958]
MTNSTTGMAAATGPVAPGRDNAKELDKAFRVVHRRNIRNGLIFIAPNFIGFAVLIMFPVLTLFYICFSEWSAFGDPTFTGAANWIRLAKDDLFWTAFWNTCYYALVHIPLTLAIGFGLGVLLNSKLKGRAFFRTAAYFPYITSIVAAAQVWNMMFDPNSGPINQFIRVFTGGADGWAPGWLSTTQWAMPAVIIVGTWREVGYFMILILAGLQTIPTELYEAARVDGANGWQQFWKITVPMMRPTLFFVMVTLTINSFRVLDLTLVMTEGGPGTATMVLAQYAYDTAFQDYEFGYSGAISIVLFAMCMVVTIIQFVYNNIKEK